MDKECEACVEKSLEFINNNNDEKEQEMNVTLTVLKPGEKGHIEQISGDDAIRRRIRDMGASTGALVEVIRVAPLGDPIDVKIIGYHLALRKKEAGRIRVRRINNENR